jgi:hypothetical protein
MKKLIKVEQSQKALASNRALSILQVNATSSDGRCAPYCLTSFFELLHSIFNSYDARFFKTWHFFSFLFMFQTPPPNSQCAPASLAVADRRAP